MDTATPLRTAEFLVVDTETNGLGGDACELTEVGAVLVGGGELHERWETLVETRRPLSRGIQRFTGITQEMVDQAPPAEATLPELGELLRGRVLVAHSAAFDRRVLAQAFERAGLELAGPAGAVHGRAGAPAAPARPPAQARAARRHRWASSWRSRTARSPTRRPARASSARSSRACARAPRRSATRSRCSGRSGRRGGAPGATDGGALPRGARRRLPDMGGVRDAPGVYVVRNEVGQPLYVGKSVRVRTRVRSHFAPSSPSTAWTARAETVEHLPTLTDLGALLLEHRTVRRLRPPGNAKLKHSDDWVWVRCRLDIAFPILEVGPAPAPAPAVNVGPLRGRATAAELVEQLVSLFGLRHCGRRLPRRDHPSAYGEMGRCLSPCLGDLDPNLYRRRLDAALGVLERAGRRRAAAARARRRSRRRGLGRTALRTRRVAAAAAGAPRGAAGRARAGASATRTARGSCSTRRRRAGRSRPSGSCAAASRTGARSATTSTRSLERTAAALRSPGPADGDELDEARLVSAWAAANDAPVLELEGGVTGARLARFLRGAGVDLGAAAPRTALAA